MADNGASSSSDAKAVVKSLCSPKIECKNLYNYLKTRSAAVLEKLYNHPTICLAVYRELPELGRQYVVRLLFVEQSVPQAVVASWGTQSFAKEQTYVIQVLGELAVWYEATIPGGLPGWMLSATFKKNLKIALLGGGKPWSMSIEVDSKARDVTFLDNYSSERWECLLHYMVGSHHQEGISADAVRVLIHGGLMKCDEVDGNSLITRKGFQFLLLDRQTQVWHFILQYLDTVESRGIDLADCLTFLFQLSFSTLGKDYSTEGMSTELLSVLQHLREFGLVYQRKRKAGRFYPTRLALNITNTNTKTNIDENTSKGYIVVETNYRVYAYTESTLQVALLALFTELMYKFPNVVVGVITRDSIRQALRGGITAEQIIGYLRQHVHPQLLAKDPKNPLPPTIVDQIKLWELERNRLTYSEGILFNQFISQTDFIVLRDFALSKGYLIWSHRDKRCMVINKANHDDVKKYWKKYSKGK